MGKTLAITSSPSSIPPLNHHPPLPLVEAAKAGVEKQRFRSAELRPRTSTGNGKAHTGKPRRHRLFTEALQTVDSGSVDKRNKKNLGAIFKKKRKTIFKKAESKKKKKAEFRRKAED